MAKSAEIAIFVYGPLRPDSIDKGDAWDLSSETSDCVARRASVTGFTMHMMQDSPYPLCVYTGNAHDRIYGYILTWPSQNDFDSKLKRCDFIQRSVDLRRTKEGGALIRKLINAETRPDGKTISAYIFCKDNVLAHAFTVESGDWVLMQILMSFETEELPCEAVAKISDFYMKPQVEEKINETLQDFLKKWQLDIGKKELIRMFEFIRAKRTFAELLTDYDQFEWPSIVDYFMNFARTGKVNPPFSIKPEDIATADPFNTHDPYNNLSFIRSALTTDEEPLPAEMVWLIPGKLLLGLHPQACMKPVDSGMDDWNMKQVLYTLLHTAGVRVFFYVPPPPRMDFFSAYEALAQEAWHHKASMTAEDASNLSRSPASTLDLALPAPLAPDPVPLAAPPAMSPSLSSVAVCTCLLAAQYAHGLVYLS